MSIETILKDVTEIFKDVLDEPSVVLKKETTAKDVENWDSLNHIQLIVAIEKKFKIKFTTPEIRSWKNVGDMCDLISKKLS